MIQNFVLRADSRTFQYFIETCTDETSLKSSFDGASFIGNAISTTNGYIMNTESVFNTNFEYQTLRIWFPAYSIDTFRTGFYYLVDVKTYVCGKETSLGTFVIDRYNALCGWKVFNSIPYTEYVDIQIPNVKKLLYGDEWTDFRKSINENLESFNSETTNIIVCVTPALYEDNIYKIYKYDSGVAVLELDEEDNDMKVVLSTNISESTETPKFIATIKFNNMYDNLLQYISETYCIENPILLWEFYISKGTETYTYLKSNEQEQSVSFTIDDLNFESWDDWVPYSQAYVKCYIIHQDGIYTFESNKINITQDVIKYFIKSSSIKNKNIPLSKIQMINYNIDFVNKVVKNVISVERPADYKANIIKPVFFKVKDGININIHKDVSENICLPLNQYKAQCSMFYLKIEDATFPESGRVSEGVIFKIDCGKLTKKLNTSTYYILNSDMELITSGKYTYI